MRWPTIEESSGLILLLLVGLSLYKAHKSVDMKSFNLFDLLMENGRVSRVGCVFMGSWAALTYVFVGMYITGRMTDSMYMAYGTICFAPIIAKMFAGPSSTTTVSSTSSTEITEKKT